MRCLPALFLLALTSCGDASGPNADPSRYAGTWTVNVDAAPNCWPAFQMAFEITAETAKNATGGVMNVVEHWWFTSNPSNRQLMTGSFEFRDKAFTLVLFRNGRSARFLGQNPTPTRLTGSFFDGERAFISNLNCGLPEASAVATK